MKNNLKSTIREIATQAGMDYFGISDVERLKNAPLGRRPNDLLPKGRSVISLGVKIGVGVRQANMKAYAGLRGAIYVYMVYGYHLLNQELNNAAYRVTRFLEKNGYRSIPIPASAPHDNLRLMGVISNRHAAVAAGLGEFGWNTLLITPDAGPRVRVVTVITEAPLEVDPMYSGPQICDKEKCGLACIKACPVRAFTEEKGVELTIGDKTFEYSLLDKWRCKFGGGGLLNETLALSGSTMPEEANPETYLEALEKESPWQKMEGEGPYCGRCIIHCPVGL